MPIPFLAGCSNEINGPKVFILKEVQRRTKLTGEFFAFRPRMNQKLFSTFLEKGRFALFPIRGVFKKIPGLAIETRDSGGNKNSS